MTFWKKKTPAQEDPLKLTYSELEQHRNQLLKLADQRREEFGKLETVVAHLTAQNQAKDKQHEQLENEYSELLSKNTQLIAEFDALNVRVNALQEKVQQQARLGTKIVEQLEKRNAELTTLLVEANVILQSIPPSLLRDLSRQAKARIADWQARCTELAIPDTQEMEGERT
jgi:DNA repair exonuclease SbcCD ATPase subunit